MKPINRRKALSVVAAAPAAVALPVALAIEGPSELALLVRRYFVEVDEFNNVAVGLSDDEFDELSSSTFHVTLQRIIGTPARSKEDALAALEFLEREDMIEEWCGDCAGLSESLAGAIRGYIEGRLA